MAGLLQTVKPVAASNNALQATTPVKSKVGNKKVTPVNSTGRAFNPRNPDGTVRYSGGPVESPLLGNYRPPSGSAQPATPKSTPHPNSVEAAMDKYGSTNPNEINGDKGSYYRRYADGTKVPHNLKYSSGWDDPGNGMVTSPLTLNELAGYEEPYAVKRPPAANEGDQRFNDEQATNRNAQATGVDTSGRAQPTSAPRPPIISDPTDMRGNVGDGVGFGEKWRDFLDQGGSGSSDTNNGAPNEPLAYDSVEGRDYNYEAQTQSLTGAPKPTVGTGNYDQIDAPNVDEADYSDITAPDQSSAGLTQDSSVAQQLNGLLSQDNPYIQQARQQAAEAAAARGLRNSSMAVQAGQEAAIRQALPIAQQDAQQSYQLERDAAQANYTSDLARFQSQLEARRDSTLQKYGLDKAGYDAMLQGERDRVMQEYNLDSREYDAALQEIRDNNLFEMDKEKMSTQQRYTQELEQLRYRQQQGLMDREGEIRMRQLERQNELTQERDKLLNDLQQNTMTLEHAQRLESMQQEFENRMTGMSAEMDHQNRLNYTNSMTQAQVAAMEQIGMIYQNPEMTPEQQRAAVNGVYAKLGETYDTLEGLFGNLPGVDFAESGGGGGSQPGVGDDWGISDPRYPGVGGPTKPGGRVPELDGLLSRTRRL